MKNIRCNKETATRAVSLFLIMITALLGSGCASITTQKDPLAPYMMTQQPQQAVAALDALKLSDRDQIIYNLDKGILLRMQGDLKGSNAILEPAKAMIQKLDAVSIREQAAAVSVNDSMRSYLPPTFERAMLHVVMALNYLEQNDYNDARIEALQLNELLKQHKDDDPLPFAHYIIGLIFEANGELDDALIAYRHTYNDYHTSKAKIPLLLKQDLLRLTQHLGLEDEEKKYSEEFQLKSWPTQAALKQQGQVVAILFNGLIPRKQSEELNFLSPRDGPLHRISVPSYESRVPQISNAKLIIANNSSNTQLLDELDQHAYANLSAEMPAIITRTVARVAVKNRIVDKTRDQSPLLGLALNIATFISETADTRAWKTLPQDILIARSVVAPGNYTIEMQLENGQSKSWPDSNIAKEKIRFVSWHWANSHVTGRRPRQ